MDTDIAIGKRRPIQALVADLISSSVELMVVKITSLFSLGVDKMGQSGINKGTHMKTMIILLLISVFSSVQGFSRTVEHGKASIYTINSNGGTKTASGVKLENHSNMVAHKTLPFGTKLKITNLHNNKTTEAIVVDRGPYIRGRIIDLTTGVANILGITRKQGVANVKIEVVGKIQLNKKGKGK